MAERHIILNTVHTRTLRHAGIQRTYQFVRKYYYWPNMKADIRQMIQTCIPCQYDKACSGDEPTYDPIYKGTAPA